MALERQATLARAGRAPVHQQRPQALRRQLAQQAAAGREIEDVGAIDQRRHRQQRRAARRAVVEQPRAAVRPQHGRLGQARAGRGGANRPAARPGTAPAGVPPDCRPPPPGPDAARAAAARAGAARGGAAAARRARPRPGRLRATCSSDLAGDLAGGPAAAGLLADSLPAAAILGPGRIAAEPGSMPAQSALSARAVPLPDRSPLGWLIVLPLGCLILAQALLAWSGVTPVLDGLLADPDSYMRLNRVLALHDGGSWFDSREWRINPPEGHVQHWTRPLDLILLAGAWLLEPWLGFGQALHLFGVLLSPLMLASVPDRAGLGGSAGARSRRPPVRLSRAADAADRDRLFEPRPARPPHPAAAALHPVRRPGPAAAGWRGRAAPCARRRRGRRARGLDQPRGAGLHRARGWSRSGSAGCSVRAASRATSAISSPARPCAWRWRS